MLTGGRYRTQPRGGPSLEHNWNEQCLGVGYNGLVNHTWTAYYCGAVGGSSPTGGPGLYILYLAY